MRRAGDSAGRRTLIPLLLVSAWLGGCLGDGTGPSGTGGPAHPLHGKWYSKLGEHGYPDTRYRFHEYEYRPDGRIFYRYHDYRRDTLTGLPVLDTTVNLAHRVTYAAEGDIVTESLYHAAHDTLVSIYHYQATIRGDSLRQRSCTVFAGKGPGLEGLWEAQVPSAGGRLRVIVEFRGGVRYDTVFAGDRPVDSREPVAYRILDDSTYVLGDGADALPDTLGYRIRNGRLVLLSNSYMDWLFRDPPPIP